MRYFGGYSRAGIAAALSDRAHVQRDWERHAGFSKRCSSRFGKLTARSLPFSYKLCAVPWAGAAADRRATSPRRPCEV